MKLAEENDDIPLDVLSTNRPPSEIRQLLNRLNASIAKLNQFRDMTKIMAQSLDSLNVKMLDDHRAQLLGEITAETYAQLLSMIALQTFHNEELLTRFGGSNPDNSYARLINEEIERQLEGALPDYMRTYMKKVEGKPIPVLLRETHTLLADLNAKILLEFNPSLTSMKFAISYAMQKIFMLSQICMENDPMQKMMELTNFLSGLMVDIFRHFDQLFEGKVQLVELAELMKNLNALVEYITMPGGSRDELSELDKTEVSKLLLSLIPISGAVTEAMQINQIKTLEVSSEFYEAVQFSQKLTPSQFTKLMEATPKILRLALETQAQQVINLAWDIDQEHFFAHFFEMVQDPELQATILRATCNHTMQFNLRAMLPIYTQAQVFCSKNVDHPGVPLLQQLSTEYKHLFLEPESNADVVPQASLQQASFSRFLSDVTDQTQGPVMPTIVQPAIYDEIIKSIDDSLIGPGF